MKKLFSVILASAMVMQVSSFSAMAEDEIVIHVSTTGASTGTGTATDPVDSLNNATEIAKNYVDKAVKIAVHGGKYKIDNTLTLNNGNRNSQLTYVTYGDGEVIFTGATELEGKDFENVTDASVLKRIPKEARANVLQYDLSKEGIDYRDSDNLPYLYVNNNMKTMSRYPNDGHLFAKDANGTTSFTFTDVDVSKWESAKDMQLCGSTGATFFWYTADASVSGSVITADRTVRKNTEFFVENLVEEIDVPGEYAIDRENDIL